MSPASRRQILSAAAVGVGGAAVSVGLTACASGSASERASAVSESVSAASAEGRGAGSHGQVTVPFHGEHQAGIVPPAQAHSTFLGLELRPKVGRTEVVRMLQLLSDDAARLTQGKPALGDTEPEMAALPARLTVTFGFGPGLFDRVGLAGQRPPSVAVLPASRGRSWRTAGAVGTCCSRCAPMTRSRLPTRCACS